MKNLYWIIYFFEFIHLKINITNKLYVIISVKEFGLNLEFHFKISSVCFNHKFSSNYYENLCLINNFVCLNLIFPINSAYI